jgi:hypothetical protein
MSNLIREKKSETYTRMKATSIICGVGSHTPLPWRLKDQIATEPNTLKLPNCMGRLRHAAPGRITKKDRIERAAMFAGEPPPRRIKRLENTSASSSVISHESSLLSITRKP